MPLWLQHLLVLTLVAACVLGVLWQAIRTLRGARRLGSCCARGCGSAEAQPPAHVPRPSAPPRGAGRRECCGAGGGGSPGPKPREHVQRLVVIPADSIGLPKRK